MLVAISAAHGRHYREAGSSYLLLIWLNYKLNNTPDSIFPQFGSRATVFCIESNDGAFGGKLTFM